MAASTIARRGRRRGPRRRDLLPYLFVLPNVLLLLVFVLIPITFTFGMSFAKWQGLSLQPQAFVGLGNYLDLTTDDVFLTALRNTFLYSVGTVVPLLALGLGVAMVLNSRLRGRTFFRVVTYLPVVISWVAGAVIWQLIFVDPGGILNVLLGYVGIPPQLWTNDPVLALPSIMFLTFWKGLGFYVLIYLAGLQTIPPSIDEAAVIDGAGRWQLFRMVTLPLLRPTTLFALVIGIIGSFQIFVPVLLMTGGGPGYASMVLVMAIYRAGFQLFQMGYASAIAVVLFLATLIISLLQFKFFGQEVQY
jgi:ABC-type sugar transport system permease subunit